MWSVRRWLLVGRFSQWNNAKHGNGGGVWGNGLLLSTKSAKLIPYVLFTFDMKWYFRMCACICRNRAVCLPLAILDRVRCISDSLLLLLLLLLLSKWFVFVHRSYFICYLLILSFAHYTSTSTSTDRARDRVFCLIFGCAHKSAKCYAVITAACCVFLSLCLYRRRCRWLCLCDDFCCCCIKHYNNIEKPHWETLFMI